MGKIDDLYDELRLKKKEMELELAAAEQRLHETGSEKYSIIIKRIGGKFYYYKQWREGGKVKSKFLSAAAPGAVADEERRLLSLDKLTKDIRELNILITYLDKMLMRMQNQRKKERLMESFTFEVYWKDEITARVYVRAKDVVISRFTDNPVRQLFAQSKMTRFQLGQILECRCLEKGRPDIQDILNAWGLSEYNPYEIIRKTHGVSYNDYIWFRFPGEALTSKDVLVR